MFFDIEGEDPHSLLAVTDNTTFRDVALLNFT
jgi:hypothetical protein